MALVVDLCAVRRFGRIRGVVGGAAVRPSAGAEFGRSGSQRFWFVSRASGVTAYVLLWLSVVLGLLMSTRLSRSPRMANWTPALMAIHEFVGIVSWLFVALYALVLLGDTYVQASWFNLLVPFAFDAKSVVWIGLGQISLYLMAVVLVSYYVRTRIGFQAWRAGCISRRLRCMRW